MNTYIVITPVKDEEKYIELTIKSVVKQTIKPLQWIIVDDGSIDNTREIIKRYSCEYKWITGVYGGDQGQRKPGVRHIKAFYEGYKNIDSTNWDFLVKLDGDLSFDSDYFENCFGYFRKNEKLGIGGGEILNVYKNSLMPEKQPVFHVRGATKIYKRECWDAIGGIYVLPCYDTLDEVKANMMGFDTQTFSKEKVVHHRYTGKSYGKWGSSVKNGKSDYISGYHPLFMISKCMIRVFRQPYLIDSLGHFYGYLNAYLTKVEQVEDKDLIRYLRKQQLRRLFFKNSIWT